MCPLSNKVIAVSLQKNNNSMAKDLSRNVTIYVNGKEVNNTLSSIRKEIKHLENEQKKLIIGSAEYNKVSSELNKLNSIVRENTKNTRNLGLSWDNASVKLAAFSNVLMGVQTAFQMIDQSIGTMKDLAADYAEMDDVYADVMKTTGLAKDEVLKLNESFKRMDTRTSREQLNQLAYEAGKLGLSSQEAVEQFVSASDKINIALGDVLGDGAMVTIGKLAEVYSKSTKQLSADGKTLEDQMLAIGSAVNQLGQESTANEGYLVEFLSRMGGIATQANLSADAILGFASALDQDMMKQEMSATAFQKFIMQMIKKPSEFAKAAGMEVSKFADLMQKDMNEALLSVLKGFQGQGGLIALQPIFEDLGLDAARAASVISSMANSIDEIRTAQKSANEQLATGNSIMNEFNTKNNTAQAEAEKAKKRFQDVRIELGEKLYPVLVHLQKTGTVSLKVLSSTLSIVEKYPWLLGSLAVVLVDLNRKRIVNMATKMKEYALDLKRTAQAKIENAQSIITRANLRKEAVARLNVSAATKAATKAQITMNAVMASTPWWLVASAVSAVAVSLARFINKTKEAAAAEEDLREKKANLAEESLRARNEMQVDIRRIDELVASQGDESGMIDELNRKYGSVFGTYSTLSEWLDVLKGKSEDYVQSMFLQAKVAQNIADATEIDKEIKRYKEAGVQAGSFFQRAGRSAGAASSYINTLVGNVLGGQGLAEAVAAASSEFEKAQFAPLDAYYDGLEDLEKRRQGLLDEAAEDQKALEELRAKSGIAVDGTINYDRTNTPDNGFASFQTEVDSEVKKWEQVKDAAQGQIARFEVKSQEGLSQSFADIDRQAEDMIEKVKTAAKAAGVSSKETVDGIKKAADAYRAAKLEEYVKKYSEGLERVADQSSGNPMLDKVNQVAASMKPYDDKIRQLTEDQAALSEKDAEAAKQIGVLIERYKALREQLAQSAYSVIDTSVDTSGFALSGNAAEDWKKYDELTTKINNAKAAATALLEKTTDPVQREVLEAELEDLDQQRETLDGIIAGADELEKKVQKSKAMEKLIEQIEYFGNQAMKIFSSVNDILSNMGKRELKEAEKLKEANTKNLDDQLEQQLISQEEYDKRKAAIEEEYDAKQKEIERKQWQREKWLNASEAAMAAALAIMRVWSDAGNGTTAMRAAQTAVVGAATAAQLGAILSEPEPYAKGGYVKDKKIMVGEAGSEWIASHRLLTDPATAPLISALDSYQRNPMMAQVNMPAVRSAEQYRVENQGLTAAMLTELRTLSAYLKDPENRRAVISRRTQEDFERNENFLRSMAKM